MARTEAFRKLRKDRGHHQRLTHETMIRPQKCSPKRWLPPHRQVQKFARKFRWVRELFALKVPLS